MTDKQLAIVDEPDDLESMLATLDDADEDNGANAEDVWTTIAQRRRRQRVPSRGFGPSAGGATALENLIPKEVVERLVLAEHAKLLARVRCEVHGECEPGESLPKPLIHPEEPTPLG